MSVWFVVVVPLVLLLVWWLKKTVGTEKSFSIDTTVSRRVIFEFLKSPVNLEKTHPAIKKVLDIRIENEVMTFQIVEDFGPLGKKQFSMNLISFNEASHFTSHIQVKHSSSIADVLVKLDISDLQPEDETWHSRQDRRPVAPSVVTVRGSTTVTARRIFNFLISSHINSVWVKTVRNTIELLGGDSNDRSHQKSS